LRLSFGGGRCQRGLHGGVGTVFKPRDESVSV
jgi:hypothetical protein